MSTVRAIAPIAKKISCVRRLTPVGAEGTAVDFSARSSRSGMASSPYGKRSGPASDAGPSGLACSHSQWDNRASQFLPMKSTTYSILLAAAVSACASSRATPPSPQAAPAASPIAQKTAGLERRDGFIPLYIDDKQGKILLEIPRDSVRALMFFGLATGLGSNPIGLDRGAGGDNYVARFEKNGERVLVVFENWNYRSSALDNPAHIQIGRAHV